MSTDTDTAQTEVEQKTTEQAVEAQGPDTEQQQAEETDQGEETKGNEAAKYRRKLRAAESERDGLAATVEALRRAEVERLAQGLQVTPAALWASGAELPALVDDNGLVDPDKVTAAVEHARSSLGLAPRRVNHVPREGMSPRPPGSSAQDRMAAVVMGRTE